MNDPPNKLIGYKVAFTSISFAWPIVSKKNQTARPSPRAAIYFVLMNFRLGISHRARKAGPSVAIAVVAATKGKAYDNIQGLEKGIISNFYLMAQLTNCGNI